MSALRREWGVVWPVASSGQLRAVASERPTAKGGRRMTNGSAAGGDWECEWRAAWLGLGSASLEPVYRLAAASLAASVAAESREKAFGARVEQSSGLVVGVLLLLALFACLAALDCSTAAIVFRANWARLQPSKRVNLRPRVRLSVCVWRRAAPVDCSGRPVGASVCVQWVRITRHSAVRRRTVFRRPPEDWLRTRHTRRAATTHALWAPLEGPHGRPFLGSPLFVGPASMSRPRPARDSVRGFIGQIWPVRDINRRACTVRVL